MATDNQTNNIYRSALETIQETWGLMNILGHRDAKMWILELIDGRYELTVSRHAKKILGPRPRCRDTWQHRACRCPVCEGERYRGTAGPGAWGRTAASRSGHRRWGCRSCGCGTCALGAAPPRTRCPGQCSQCSAFTAVVEIKCGKMWGNIKKLFMEHEIFLQYPAYCCECPPTSVSAPRSAPGQLKVTNWWHLLWRTKLQTADTRKSFMTAAKYVMCPTFALISLFAEAPDME